MLLPILVTAIALVFFGRVRKEVRAWRLPREGVGFRRNRAGHVYAVDPRWERLRKSVLRTYGCECMKCGAADRAMHVDHIRPKSKYPDLEFEFSNLQVLCGHCNRLKSNTDETDYRRSTRKMKRPIAKSDRRSLRAV